MALPIPRLSYEDLRMRADAILRTHHPGLAIPITIEHIVEFGFGINVMPLPGLQTIHGIDAFTSRDLRTVVVDQSVLESRSPNRYRFSLAHELAHVVLHAEMFAQITFTSVAEWKRVIASISESDWSWLEWQAYNFAGLILVPREPLRDTLEDATQRAAEQGLDVRQDPEVAEGYVYTWIGRQFEVSAQVIEKRLEKDGLWPPK